MSKVTIRTADEKTTYAAGVKVTLAATADAHADAYRWTRDGTPIPGANQSVYEFDMSADAQASYAAIATIGGGDVSSTPAKITLADAQKPANEVASPEAAVPEPPPTFHPWFAVLVGLVAIALAVGLALVVGLPRPRGGLSVADWTSLEGRLKVGLVMALPITLLGGLAVLSGLWMAIVEWRGRFAEKPKVKRSTSGQAEHKGLPVDNADKIIEAVGKLRGAALAMIVGGILLVASAWVAQSAAGTAPAATSAPAPATPAPSS